MAKKPCIDESKLISNPFVNSPEFTIRIREFREETDVVNLNKISNGVILQAAFKIPTSRVVEQENYTKLFTRQAFRLHIMALPSRARDLFLWITYELDSGKDYLWINKVRYLAECTVSLNTYKESILDLTTGGVITPTVYNDTYWINPLFFFNGDRIKKYQDKLTTV